MATDFSIYDLRRANAARQAEWPGGEHVDLAFRGLEHNGEVGEFSDSVVALLLDLNRGAMRMSNVLKKITRLDRDISGTSEGRDQLIHAVMEEAGDTLITLDLVMMELGLDLGQSTKGKFNATSAKHGLKTRL